MQNSIIRAQPHITPDHRPTILITLQLLGLRQPNSSVPLSQPHITPNHRPPILTALQLLRLIQPNCSVPFPPASVCTLSNFPYPSALSHDGSGRQKNAKISNHHDNFIQKSQYHFFITPSKTQRRLATEKGESNQNPPLGPRLSPPPPATRSQRGRWGEWSHSQPRDTGDQSGGGRRGWTCWTSCGTAGCVSAGPPAPAQTAPCASPPPGSGLQSASQQHLHTAVPQHVLVFYRTRALHLLWGLVCNRQVNNTFFTQLYINNVLVFYRTRALHLLQGRVCNWQVNNTFFTQMWGKLVTSSITSTMF